MKTNLKQQLCTRQTGKTEWLVFAVWLVLVCIIRHFHEPWFDESQAWEIARFASLRELLFEIPHYEGHPQLWHLLLLPFARAELPYKLTIFCINIAFSGAGVLLLLFRSPLPRWLRCYLPFTYFIFYMHSVHTRPYSMMMLAMFLAAMAYPHRNEKPGRYVLSLIFLCFTSVYGVVFAFGFCLVWVWEILSDWRRNARTLPAMLQDRRIWWLVLIAAVGAFIFLCTRPAPDTSTGWDGLTMKLQLKRLYYIPLIFFDSTFGAVMLEDDSLETRGTRILGCLIGALLLAAFLLLLHANKKLLQFLVPYLIGTIFNAFVYFTVHHLEIYQLLLIFTLWNLFSEEIRLPDAFGWIRSKLDTKLTILLLKGIAAAALCAPVIYAAGASFLEIRYRYGPWELSSFIKEHHLENRRILTIWNYSAEEDSAASSGISFLDDETLPVRDFPPITSQETMLQGLPAAVYADFDRDADFFPYFNAGEAQQKWMLWKSQSDEALQSTFRLWQQTGLPDVVVGSAPLQAAFPESMLDGVTYYWVGEVHCGKVWKLDYSGISYHVYLRGDLLDEYPELEVYTYAHRPET